VLAVLFYIVAQYIGPKGGHWNWEKGNRRGKKLTFWVIGIQTLNLTILSLLFYHRATGAPLLVIIHHLRNVIWIPEVCRKKINVWFKAVLHVWVRIIDIESPKIDCLRFVMCLSFKASFSFYLQWPLTVLMKQTRQAVHAFKQSILLRCLWSFFTTMHFLRNLRMGLIRWCQITLGWKACQGHTF
jgi:uncharacterized membrane protein